MKKSFAHLVVGSALLVFALVACGRQAANEPVQDTESQVVSVESAPAQPADAPLPESNPNPDASFAQRVASGELRSIRLVGDSITAGYGTEGYVDITELVDTPVIYDDGMGNVIHEQPDTVACWANEFRRWAMQQGVQGFVNAGISGWFMHDFAQNPDAWLLDGADVVVVALGTNDAGYYGPQEFEADARKALEAAEAKSKLVVVMAPVDDLRPTDLLVEPARELGDILQTICSERGYVFVDPRPYVTPEMFCEDGLHPNEAGSHAIWESLRSSLQI